MRAALTTVLVLLLAGNAQAATLRIADPVGDQPPTFNASTDLSALSVVWDGTLTVSATFAERPRTLTLDVIVSQASRDESDPSVHECDTRAGDHLTVIGTNDGGSLEVTGIDGRLEVPAEWDGATVTYRFRDPALDREFAHRDFFTCGSGTAGEDEYYGVFDGKVAKLTPATAREALEADLARRFGAGTPRARCPSAGISEQGEETDDSRGTTANAFCLFTFTESRRYRLGYATVHLESGVPVVRYLSTRAFPRALKFCGTTDFTGRGWRVAPVFGASMSAWAQRTSCRTARRVARRWRGRSRVMGFRCRRTLVEHEFVAVRCTRGRRLVRFETGS